MFGVFRLLKKKRCDLIVTDIRTPGADDVALLKQIREIRPHTYLL